jgi:hypothetical protein
MNCKLSLISLLTFFIACSDTNDTGKFQFSVPVDTISRVKVTDPTEPPPPPIVKPYYTNFNFIVDSSGILYFYQQQTYRWTCGTGLDENTPPEYIDLRPTEIVVVPKENLRRFVELNILNYDADYRVVAIGLLKDTVTSEGLYTLTQLLRDTANKTRWFLRPATQEETIALNYKKKQARFYPEDIHWDSSKTRFPPKVEITDFTTPKLEE